MRYFTTCKGSVRISISMPKSGCPNLKRTQTNMIIDSKMPGPWHAWCGVFVFFCFCFFPSFILLSRALWKAVNVCHMDVKSKTVFPPFSDLLRSKGPYFKILQGLSITELFNPDQWLHGGSIFHIYFYSISAHPLWCKLNFLLCFLLQVFRKVPMNIAVAGDSREGRWWGFCLLVLMLVDWRRGILQIIGLWQSGGGKWLTFISLSSFCCR